MEPDARLANIRILVIEDGDEYLENLSRFCPGPTYRQVHTGGAARSALRVEPAELVYLDMIFDRIPRAELLGDHAQVTREQNGDPERAWRYLQHNQGLFILAALREAGCGHLPVILSYDFSRELRRYDHLRRVHPSLRWVADGVSPGELRRLILELAGSR